MTYENSKDTTYVSLEKTTVKPPVIILTQKALNWMSVIAELHDEEVGVIGIVREDGDNTYIIDDIFYPKHQMMTGATCEISPEGEADMVNWLASKGRIEESTMIRFWGHSHVNMGTSPSAQDEDQAIYRMKRNRAYFIRGIFNKKGALTISFYDYENRRRFDNIKWLHESDELDEIRAKIEALKKVNIPEKTDTFRGSGFHQYENGGYNDNWWSNKNKNKNKNKKVTDITDVMNSWGEVDSEHPDMSHFDFEHSVRGA